MWISSLGLALCVASAGASPVVQRDIDDFPKIKNPHPKAVEFVNKLSLEEKSQMVTGTTVLTDVVGCTGSIAAIPRLGFNGICIRDGGSGVHLTIEGLPETDLVSAFANGITQGATWDRELVRESLQGIGQEAFGKGTHVLNGPVTGGPLGRVPYDGRWYENFGADPVLVGELGVVAVNALQAEHVQATVKHFIANEQETLRNVVGALTGQTPFNSVVDERTLNELYMWGFSDVILRANASGIMCTYNRINGVQLCQTPLLNSLLKEEYNFQGSVMSDWWSVYSTADSMNNGLDWDMPGGEFDLSNVTLANLDNTLLWGPSIIADVKSGKIPEARLDDAILRIMTPYYNLDQGKVPNANTVQDVAAKVKTGAHVKSIQKVGQEAITLLKNKNNALPLKPESKIGIFGSASSLTKDQVYSCSPTSACSSLPENGTDYSGFGSGAGITNWGSVVAPAQAIQSRVKSNGKGSVSINAHNSDFNTAGSDFFKTTDNSDTAIVFISLHAGEGSDLPSLHAADGGDKLVNEVADRVANTIVVIYAGNPVITSAFDSHPNVTAILFGFTPGEQIGNALVPVLFGDVSPSGKLPFTIAKKESDNIQPMVIPSDNPQVVFKEGLAIDYRYFDKNNIEPAYPFGFGLSYTTFKYTNLDVQGGVSAGASAVSSDLSIFDAKVTVKVTVQNTGSVEGSEIVQIYLEYPESAGEPPKVLRGFEKAKNIAPGASSTVTVKLSQKSFSIYDVDRKKWVVPSGHYELYAAASSRDPRLTHEFDI